MKRKGPASSADPTVSVIVVNWNGLDVLGDCLRSLERQTYRDFEVIVVDNGSHDGSEEIVKLFGKRWRKVEGPSLTLVELSENQGFCGGNNAGVARARGTLIALLNNDAEAEKDWLSSLVEAARARPDYGQFASKLLLDGLDEGGRRLIDNTGHLLYPDGLNCGRGRLEEERGRFDEPGEILCPSGAAALYRREALEDAAELFSDGPFDEDFFCYGDDLELGLRLRRAGWPAYYVPGAVVLHKHSHSLEDYSPLKAYYIERNRLWVAIKHFPLRDLAISPFFTLWRYGWNVRRLMQGEGAAGRFVDGQGAGRLAWALVHADASAVAGAPRMLAKRLLFAPKSRLSGREFRRWAGRWRIGARDITKKE